MQVLKATSRKMRLLASLDIDHDNSLILKCRNKVKSK